MLFFFQAEDGIRDLVRSRGLGDVYKRQELGVGDPVCDAGSRPGRNVDSAAIDHRPVAVEDLSLIHI